MPKDAFELMIMSGGKLEVAETHIRRDGDWVPKQSLLTVAESDS